MERVNNGYSILELLTPIWSSPLNWTGEPFSYNLGMIKLFSALSVVCLLASTSAIDVRVTCEACRISCSSANCFRIRGDGYDNQVCQSGNPCQIGEDYTVSVEKCHNNFYGDDCNRGFCYYPSNKAECASSIMGIDSCEDPSWYNVGCGNCQDTDNCNQCRRIQT